MEGSSSDLFYFIIPDLDGRDSGRPRETGVGIPFAWQRFESGTFRIWSASDTH